MRPGSQPQQGAVQLLDHPAALRSVVELLPAAMETVSRWASVAGPGQGSSTERGSQWRLRARLLSVFVAFSLAARIIVRPKPLRSSVLLHWIVAARTEWMTTEQSAKRERTSSKGAVTSNRLGCIFRTSWRESARCWKKR